MDLDDLDQIDNMIMNRDFPNKSECIRKLFKVGYYVMLNKKKVVNTSLFVQFIISRKRSWFFTESKCVLYYGRFVLITG